MNLHDRVAVISMFLLPTKWESAVIYSPFFCFEGTRISRRKVNCECFMLLNKLLFNNKKNFVLLFPISERFNTISSSPPPVDDIPEIPDFEDIIDEIAPIDAQETKAVAANRVETYKELNSELLKYSEIASSENIDLSKLMRCLLDESILVDFDVPLTKEQLFNEVASIMREQQAKTEREETVETVDG